MLISLLSDMNDRNVMIGDYDFEDDGGQHAHDHVPKFKVGDLGIIRSYRPHSFTSPVGASVQMAGKVASRIIGNYWCYTPEQFTRRSSRWPLSWVVFFAVPLLTFK